MGSVQSYIRCPECQSPEAIRDAYYKSYEEYVYCDACGYNYSRTLEIDNAKGLNIKKKVDKLILKGNLDKALKIANRDDVKIYKSVNNVPTYISILDCSDEEKKQHLNSIDYDNYIKIDKNGKYVFKEIEKKGCGSFKYGKKDSVMSCGSFEKEDDYKIFIEDMKKAKKEHPDLVASYTKDTNGVWKKFDVFEEAKK